MRYTGRCDTLIYFWLKNKPEELFQITNLLSLLPLGCYVFMVGKNRGGVPQCRGDAGRMVSAV
ncbi:hypothetical protein [Sodalis-like endosymbiont of Proechinophthirus fluctus]|uniref:hypothetical protein n=1 Tax=Sodalis-like endosymbiont of Proechinophthirus fluctus TaxID=1462730 RepID=UPI0034E93986